VESPSGKFLVVAAEDEVAQEVAIRADEMLAEIESFLPYESECLVRIHISSTDQASRQSRFVKLPFYGGWIHLPENYTDALLQHELVHAALDGAAIGHWPHSFQEGFAVFLRRHSESAARSSAVPASYVMSAAGLSESAYRIRYNAEEELRWTRVYAGPGGRLQPIDSLERILSLQEHEYEALSTADRDAIAGSLFALLEGIEAWSGVANYLKKHGKRGGEISSATLLAAAGLASEEEYWAMLPELARVMAGNVLLEGNLALRALESVDVDPTQFTSSREFLAAVDPQIEFDGLTRSFAEFEEYAAWAEAIWGPEELLDPVEVTPRRDLRVD
jgi:hypothetical protein